MWYLLLAPLAGLLLTFSFAPFSLGWAALLPLTVLCWLWQRPAQQRPLLYGWLFALGFFASGLYWVYISLYYYGNAPLPFAILANVLLVLFMSLYGLAVGWLLRRCSAPDGWRRVLLIPPAWVAAELLRAYVLTGFPWLAVGYSALHTPLDGIAPLGGVFVLSLLLMFIASLLARAWLTRSWRVAAAAVALYAAASASSLFSFVAPTGAPFSVALVQGNVEQSTKFAPGMMERHLQDYIATAIDREESVVVLPETAFTFMEEQLRTDLDQLDRYFKARGQTLVTGIPAGDLAKDIFFNAVVALGDGQGHYYKHHLLPFGEYIPLRDWLSIFEKYVDIPYSNFSRGDAVQTPLFTGKHRAGVSICFEAAFGRDVRHALPTADYLINVSNDAWFKDSIAADQHLQMNQMRCREMGREMARATNAGYTVLLDATGRVKARLPRFERGVLSGEVQPYAGLTPYARFGNAIVFSLLALCAVVLLLGRRRWR